MKKYFLIGAGSILAVLILLFMLCFRIVPTGRTAVITTFGKVEDFTLPAGAHFKSPFQRITLMDNRERRLDFDTLAFSSDIQEVRIVGSFHYNIDKETAMNLYRTVGVGYDNTVIEPRLMENIKGVFARFTADGLIQNRSSLSGLIKEDMTVELNEYGINIIAVAVKDVDFSNVYTDAVEAKQVAEQTRLKGAIEQDQLTNEARKKAERDVIQAQAQFEMTKKSADAEAYAVTQRSEAEAIANIKLAKSITPELTAYLEVQRWNGQRVIEINGGTVPVISLPGLVD